MSDQTPPTETITATDARQHFASVINRVARKQARILIEKSGIPVASIVSAEDMRDLANLDSQRVERYRILEAMRAPFRDVPPEEIEREAARSIAEVRAESREERDRGSSPGSLS